MSAPRSEHDPDAAPILAAGEPLLLRLSALMRTARTYDVSNQAFRRQLEEFTGLLKRLFEEEEEIALVVVADYLYLNGVRIKAHTGLLGPYHALMADFERRQVGGLRFLQGVTDAEVERFFQIFVASEDGKVVKLDVKPSKVD